MVTYPAVEEVEGAPAALLKSLELARPLFTGEDHRVNFPRRQATARRSPPAPRRHLLGAEDPASVVLRDEPAPEGRAAVEAVVQRQQACQQKGTRYAARVRREAATKRSSTRLFIAAAMRRSIDSE